MSSDILNLISSDKTSVRSVIDTQATRYGDHTFLICPQTQSRISYRDLKVLSKMIFDLLQHRKVPPRSKIAILLDNGIGTAQLFLSLMYCGHVAVPLNCADAVGGWQRTLEDSDASAIFLSHSCKKQFIGSCSATNENLAVIEYSESTSELESCGDEGLCDDEHLVDAEAEALIAYTSGSTGRPKGALFTHANLLTGGYNTVVAHSLTESDKTLLVLPLYHMNAQIVTLMSTLLSGGEVIVPRHFNVNSFWQQITQFQCTWAALVPTIVNQLLLQEITSEEVEAKDYLRFARSSSAPLSVAAHEQFETRFKIPMIEAMGMTEAGGAIFSNPLPPEQRKIGSPGKPYGFEVKVVDANNNLLPRGEIGEILLRGKSVMQGYYKQPDTAPAQRDGGWLSTGDLGKQDEDGFIFITGRKSDVINRGGDKIAPRQIEEFLMRQEQVLEAAVIGIPSQIWGQEIGAFVVPKDPKHFDREQLLKSCEKQLGSLKTPDRLIVIDELPKGTAHKINRTALAELALAAESADENNTSSHKFRASSLDEIETEVLKTMAVLLQQPNLLQTDNFFDSGGYSLRALQLVHKLSQDYPIQIPISALFRGPTAKQLASFIYKALHPPASTCDSNESSRTSLIIIRESGSKPPLFFTPGGNGGDVEFIVYARLARLLDRERPFYGFKARASIEGLNPHLTVAEMAADYLKEMRSVQPKGPYFLAGECSGAVIAYEMAQQLAAKGEQVAQVVMLDCLAPSTLNYTLQRFTWFRNRILGIAGRKQTTASKLANTLPSESDRSSADSQSKLPQKEIDRRWLNYKRPLLQYIPRPYSGSVHLVLSEECRDFQNSWKSVGVHNLKVVVVTGSHYEYIRENATETAKSINTILAYVDS